MSQDIIKATIDLLTADSGVLAKVNGTPVAIFGEIPKSFFKKMPRNAISIIRAPGLGGGNTGGYQELEETELDIYCFGKSPLLADQLSRIVYQVLKQARRQVRNSTLLHSFKIAGAPSPNRDDELRWPFVLSSWMLLASETAAS